jgi:hypothetical protein
MALGNCCVNEVHTSQGLNLLLHLLALVSAETELRGVAAPVEARSAESVGGKIIMFRPPDITGAAVACPIRYRGHELVELGRGKWAEWQVKPGRYILANKTHSVEVNVAAGETRYVRCSMQMGVWTFRADLQMVDEYTWNQSGNRYVQKAISNPPES